MSKKDNRLETLKRIRGIQREEHFKKGGSLVDWRGGTRTVTENQKHQRNKRACRGKFSE